MSFRYFSSLPVLDYPLDLKQSKKARDILHRIFVDQRILDKSDYIRTYEVNDGDRPEIISQKLYGRTDIYSIIMLLNDFDTTLLSGLPPTSRIYDQYINNKYSDGVYYLTPVNENLSAAGSGLSGGYIFPIFGYGFEVGERIFGTDSAGFQNYSTRAYVKEWDPVMCTLKLDVLEGSFGAGLTLANANGDVHFKITMVKDGVDAIHHFETTRGTTSGTPVMKGMIVDPLSRIQVQSGSAYYIPLGTYNQTIGITGGYNGTVVYVYNLTGNVLPSSAPFIRPVTNREYEERLQEKKRTINVPATERNLLGQVINRFSELLQSTNTGT